MQTSDWEKNGNLEYIESTLPPSEETEKPVRGAIRVSELRRRLEERLDSKRIEMEYGGDYLTNDESLQ